MIFRFMLILALIKIIMSTPTGCTYDTQNVLYTCSARSWSLPLVFSSFTVQPQRLLLKDVAGELPALAPNGLTFSGFSATNTALFDTRFSPSFHIMCYKNSAVIIFKETFRDFGWVEEVTIQDCDILSLPVEVFSYFGEVNSFIIQGGSVANIFPDSFKGLDIKKKSNVKTPKGEFIIRNCKIVSEQLPLGALYTFKNAESMILDNNHIGSLAKDTFYSNSKLTNLSISYNLFNSIPEAFFSGSHSIEYMRVWGIPWTCSCSDLWFIPYVNKNKIVLEGDLVCSSPSHYANKKVTWYYWKHCTNSDLCDQATGVVIGGMCFTVINIVWYVLVLVTSFVAFVAFGLVIGLHNYLKRIKALNQGTSLLKRNIAGKLARVIESKLQAIHKSYAIDKNMYNTQEDTDFEVIEDTPEQNTKKKNGEPSILHTAQENKDFNLNKYKAKPNTKRRNEEASTEYTTQENKDYDKNKNTAKAITQRKSNEPSEIKRNQDFNERDIVSPLYWRDATQKWLYR